MLMRFGTPPKRVEARADISIRHTQYPGSRLNRKKKLKCGIVVVQEDVAQLKHDLVMAMIGLPQRSPTIQLSLPDLCFL